MNIGLVLSGGMAKGAYQIGVLKALNHFIPLYEIKYISSASIGVLNSYAYATQQLETAENMWKNLCSDHTRLFISKIIKSSILQQNIQQLCSDKNNIFASAFYCSLLDLSHKSIVYKNLSSVTNNDIPKHLSASIAMPLYNRAVHINNVPYFDGAIVDNIPVFPLMKHNLDYIICVYFDDVCYKFENIYFDNKIIKIAFPLECGMRQSLELSSSKIDYMINYGYERAYCILKNIFNNGYEDIEYIYNAIPRPKITSKTSLRITGDVLVTNLNRFTQKFLNRNILL